MPKHRTDLPVDGGPAPTLRERRLRALYRGEGLPRVRGAAPRVVVVGAGLAGLTAATLLRTGGCEVALFEADTRIGGRTWTERVAGPGSPVVECGGEFIDTQHVDLLALVRHLGLALLDTGADPEPALREAYQACGRVRSEHDFDTALAQLAVQVDADARRCSARPQRRRHTAVDAHFDKISIAEYLQALDTEPWVRRLVETAYVTVYGLDAGEQSSLNLLTLMRGTPSIFGDSDERYKLQAGSQAVADALAGPLADVLYTGHRLVRLRRPGAGVRLTVERPGGRAAEVDADAVVLALPFTLLRAVDTGDCLPPAKRRAIAQLGYGHNSKLMAGLREPVWRRHGFDGGGFADLDYQSTWDCSRLREAEPAVFTYYLGGDMGRTVGQGRAEDWLARFASQSERVYPGFEAALTGFVRRVHWPSQPFALGSYTCYRPGQWTTIGGDEATAAGPVHFAGEHCATGSQGYMDGAVQTGREAALAILRRAG
jgi:monoamine oxidase